MTADKEYTKITRREALKYMGATVVGLSLGMTGVSSLASCSGQTKRRLVFYFTGTGNCLYVAKHFSEEPLSIPQVMKSERLEFEADEIGIVYPIYGHIAPKMVQEFIKKAKLKAPYLFAILTYGNRKCNAVELWDEMAKASGYQFNYINTIKMVDNYLPSFDMNEQILIDKKEDEQIASAVLDIDSRRNWMQPVSQEEREQHAEFLKRAGGLLSINAEELIEIKDNCIGCGICTRICPRANYKLTGEGLKCEGICEFCLACVHNCPQKVLGLKLPEKNPAARYRHAEISLNQIIRANKQ